MSVGRPCSLGLLASSLAAKRWRTRADWVEVLTQTKVLLETSNLEIEAIAAQVGVSAPHLRAEFKKQEGKGLREFRSQVRLESSLLKVLETDLPIQQIGAATGFQNSSAFGRAFKKRYGVTPAAMRENHRSSTSNQD